MSRQRFRDQRFTRPQSQARISDVVKFACTAICRVARVKIRAMKRALSAAVMTVLVLGCGGRGPSFHEVAPTPRRLVVWLGDEGLDSATAQRMRDAGVDEIVVRRGSMNLSGQAPVLRFNPAPPVEGAIPVGIELEVQGVRADLDRSAADAVWRAIDAELAGSVPAELILDLPRLAEGLDEFVTALTEASGVSVVPLLSFDQIQNEEGLRTAAAARKPS